MKILEELKREIFEPPQASAIASPILLVIFPPIDIIKQPKTSSWAALKTGLMQFSSLNA